MKKLIFATVLSLTFSFVSALAQQKTFFQVAAGNWEGTLEYQDYSGSKRVKLKTYLTVTPGSDGNSAEFTTVYDDFGKIIKNKETVKVDLAAKKYVAGDAEYKIDFATDSKIILLGSGQDGEKVEPIRETITFSADSLEFLKETRTPWQFRNQKIFRRASENVLAAKTLSVTQLKEDFNIFKRVLTTLHPGVYRYQTPASLEKLFSEFEVKLKSPISENKFFILLSQFTNQIYCGHTYLNPYNQNSLVRERLFGGKTYLPFYFEIINGKMIVTENALPNSVVRGSEIRRINNIPVKKIVETLLTVTKADGRNTLPHRIKSLELNRFEAERYALFDWYFPLFFPVQNDTFNIEATDFKTKKQIEFQVSAMTKAERTAAMERLYGKSPTYDDNWKFEIQENSTAYLKIPNSITWRLKNIKFKEFIAAAFAQMRSQKIENLIVDLRGNSGGDTNIGFELFRHLAKSKLPAYLKTRRLVRNVAAQPELVQFFDIYNKEIKTALQNGVPENLYTKTENGFFEVKSDDNFPIVTPAENNFFGKTFIIADSSNASASFQLLNYAQTNQLAVIVGQESGGNKQGINGDNYLFLNLPNSKFEIDIPVFHLAPSTFPQKDESVKPDVYVNKKAEDVGEGIDTELMTIKELIRKN